MTQRSGVNGKTIKRDREALHLEVEILAAAAGVKAELLRGYETGNYSASTAMHLELTFTIQSIEALLAAKPDGLNLSDAASLRNLVLRLHWGDFGGCYIRLLREWEKTFKKMRESGEVVSDHPPYLDHPSQSKRP